MKFKPAFERLVRVFFLGWEHPVAGFLLALGIYFYINAASGFALGRSDYAYFNYLADAFLHGQLHLRLIPQEVHDLVFFGGRYYLYWPPMPAVVLMPLVAVFGVGLSDFLLNNILAAVNVALVAVLLRKLDARQVVPSTPVRRGVVVALLALGSVHFPMAVGGTVWLTGQLLGFMAVTLAYLSAVSLSRGWAFFVTGLMIAVAMLTRNNLLFMGVWPALYLVRAYWGEKKTTLAGWVALGLLPALLGGLAYLAYNAVRFGNPFEVGLDYHEMSPFFMADYERYGPFNLHYVPINFYYQYIYYPFTRWPPTEELFLGGGLFLLSPLFLAAFWGIYQHRDRLDTWGWVVSILLTNIPIITLMGTGWIQQGPRYTLDFTLALLMLTLLGLRYWRTGLIGLTFLVSMVHYFLMSLLKT